jgi:transmembrane sensor
MKDSTQNSRKRIVEEASEWVVRLQDEDLSYEQIEEWNRWMEASREHAQAFEDVSLMWQVSAQLPGDLLPAARTVRSDTTSVPRPPVESHQAVRPSRSARRGGRLRWAVAAAILGVTVAGVAVRTLDDGDGPRTDAVQVFATGKGELKHLVLEDRSQVELGPDSRLRVQIGPQRRQIELTGGQAYFTVAKDPARPFEVRAGGLIAQALGTEFSVEAATAAVSVTVAEGHVQVNDVSPEQDAVADGEKTVQLIAGQQTTLDEAGGLSAPRRVDLEDALAWKEGSVVYASEPLRNVVADLNRYSRVRVVLDDAALAERPVTGRWLTSDVDAWLDGVAGAFSLQVLRYPDRIVLQRRKDATDR